MEPSDFPSLFNSDEDNYIKSKPRILNFTYNTAGNNLGSGVASKQSIRRESLTTKNALKFLLEGRLRKKVCRYCLNVASSLSELDQVLQVAGSGKLFKVTIRDMVASFYPYKVVDDPNFPNKICNKCLNQTIRSYLFTQQCERSERALRNCFEDMYSKLEKLDSMEPRKKRGRQKLNPNYNILYANYEKVIHYAEPIINIVNSGTELTETVGTQSNFECSKCWQILPSMESLLNHEKQHPKSMWYNCRHCGKSFTKYNLLKKHLRSAHNSRKRLQLPKTNFKCTDCGLVSEKYNVHLQHIEKHKFQMVIEHLMERNMDKLCAVCLGKNLKLADLDDLVYFHGGFPEMMGERTLYSILGSTIPDKSSYKYRELLIANHTKVVSISKINKDTETYNFAISSPIVLSKEGTDFDDIYSFIFCSPRYLENDVTKPNDGAIEAFKTNDTQHNIQIVEYKDNDPKGDADIQNKFMFTEDMIDNDFLMQSIGDTNKITFEFGENMVADKSTIHNNSINEMVFSFSKPEYINEVNIADNKSITQDSEIELKDESAQQNSDIKTIKSCNVCWIFKKPTCRNCLKATENIDNEKPVNNNDEEIITQSKQCQFCWVFKNRYRCEHCKKENETSFDTSDNDSNKMVDSESKIREENTVNSNLTNKRKLTNDNKSDAKRAKWQCQICLTTNMDRNVCLCCDAQRYLKKFKFNFSTDFFKSLNGNNHNLFTVKTKYNVMSEETQNTDEVVLQDITQQLVSQINYAEKPVNSSLAEENVFEMETSNSTDVKVHSENEKMEIVDEDSSVSIISSPQSVANLSSMCDWTPNEIVPGNQTTTFQFNIGASSADDKKSVRRFKRPLRKYPTPFHK